MDNNPHIDVSVIIATYNVETYVARAIASALTQTGVSLEVIVVDDCSTDRTWETVSVIDDPRVHALQLPENGGPGVARNAGMALARGDWVAILDADDAFLPGRLRRLLDRAAAAQADIIVDNLQIERQSDGRSFPMFTARHLRRDWLDLTALIISNARLGGGYNFGYLKPVFSARFLRDAALAYEPALRIGEDYLLLAEALAMGARCAIEPLAGYLYTVRDTSISHRLSLSDVERMAAADASFVLRHQLDRPALQAQRQRTMALVEIHAFIELVQGIKQRDLALVKRAVRHCPSALLLLWRPVCARLRLW